MANPRIPQHLCQRASSLSRSVEAGLVGVLAAQNSRVRLVAWSLGANSRAEAKSEAGARISSVLIAGTPGSLSFVGYSGRCGAIDKHLAALTIPRLLPLQR